MIVKFLKSSKSFSGIKYNEERVKKGQGELIASNRFPSESLFGSTNDYAEYLSIWSERNRNIKKPQLHVVLSSEGKNTLKEELAQIGKKWMEKMGYGDVPYLIYFHNNTDNNHIHIVSTRVGLNGEKVRDSFEKERSLRIINQIEKERVGTDKDQELRNKISECLHYSFDNANQFMAILDSVRIKSYQDKETGNIVVKVGGQDPLILSMRLVDFCSIRYRERIEVSRKKQLYSILMKYSKIGSKEAFATSMKSKFGIDVVFFGKKETPYGYCLIDHRNKMVIKGSEVCKLKDISNNMERFRNIDWNTVVDGELSKNKYLTARDLSYHCSKLGGKYSKGQILSKFNNDVICDIDKRFVEKIRVNNKLTYIATKYDTNSEIGINILSKLFHVEEHDLLCVANSLPERAHFENLDYYNSMLLESIENGYDIREVLQKNDIKIFMEGNEFFLMDNYFDSWVDGNRLDVDVEILQNALLNHSASYNEIVIDDFDYEKSLEDLVDILDGSFLLGTESVALGSGTAKKRRRK
jgi:hypothetical protein